MNCPRCGKQTKVKETRDGVMRWRICPREHLFWTEEKFVQYSTPPNRAQKYVRPRPGE